MHLCGLRMMFEHRVETESIRVCDFSHCPFFVGVLKLVDGALVLDEQLLGAVGDLGCRNCARLVAAAEEVSARWVSE